MNKKELEAITRVRTLNDANLAVLISHIARKDEASALAIVVGAEACSRVEFARFRDTETPSDYIKDIDKILAEFGGWEPVLKNR